MEIRTLIAALVLAIPILSFAGGEIGNGGDALVCSDKVVFFDVYEAASLRHYKLDLGEPQLSVEQKIKVGINRLLKVDPFRARMIELLIPKFFSKTLFVKNVELTNIRDTNEIFLPKGCVLEQISIQNKKTISSDPDFVVDEDLWNRLDNDSKAALIFHEIIFSMGDERMNSRYVRVLNSFIFSNFIDINAFPDSLEPNLYYQNILGTPLANRLEILQLNLIPKNQNDKRWFFQIPDAQKNMQSIPRTVSRSRAAIEVEEECRVRNAKPLNLSDYNKLARQLDILFTGGRDSTTAVWVKDGNNMTLLYPDTGVEEKYPNSDGEIWCVSSKEPWVTN